ncbi:AraC family transcriptional regulator [Pseudonocardia benzenivorans]|uniref:AraC family transcriptional regulator n=1 Tax=Pseudonocardia benzenivorans TaxID=228005 RepID=A0ABW3VGS4_9PSEU
MMGLSSGAGALADTGVHLVGYDRRAGVPPVTVQSWAAGERRGAVVPGAHAHDFLVLLFVEDGEDVLRVDGHDWTLGAGDAFVIAPGAVVGPPDGHSPARVWAVFFPADAVDPGAAAPLASWHGHPLLAAFGSTAFGGHRRGGAQRLRVPDEDRPQWLAQLHELDAELRGRRDGYADAVRAHLTLLLVRLGRLRPGPPDDPGVEPLLAAVLDVVENRFREPISLRDIAAAVGLTPGHVTTVVGRRTGRTVQQWLTERRMHEARRLLADTDLTVADIAHRVGYRDGGYFVRRFRAEHGVPPAAWRRAGRAG